MLFHFTDKLEYLQNILENKFLPRYCPEYGPYEEVTEGNPEPPHYARPMVCFCDLPFSLIKNHLKLYGHYGIGLKKEWGMMCRKSPVLYTYKKASTLETLRGLNSRLQIEGGPAQGDPHSLTLMRWFMSFVKPYEGPCWRREKYRGKVRFYDEREWRFAPLFMWDITEESDVPIQVKYKPGMDLEDYNSRIAHHFHLPFTTAHIEYIILDEESEKSDMVKKVREFKELNPGDNDTLITKITTAKRILEDT